MRKEITVIGWVPVEETQAETMRIIREEVKRMDFCYKNKSEAMGDSRTDRAKKVKIKIIFNP